MTLPLVVRIDADDERSAINLRQDGWREIEVLETWRGEQSLSILNMNCATATVADIPWMQAMAADKFKYDRLHMDPLVSRQDASQEKQAWIERAAYNSDCRLWKFGGEFGFLIAREDGADFVIDLLCVAEPRKGIATSLILNGLYYVPCTHIRAGTQSTNEAGKALYKSLGMSVVKRQRTFHK